MSIARLTFPSMLELNRPEGSFNAAPLAKVNFTTFLYVSPVQTMPACDHTGVPLHFHSSTISGSASCISSRTFARVLPRQSPSSLILPSINEEAVPPASGPFMQPPVLQRTSAHALWTVITAGGATGSTTPPKAHSFLRQTPMPQARRPPTDA